MAEPVDDSLPVGIGLQPPDAPHPGIAESAARAGSFAVSQRRAQLWNGKLPGRPLIGLVAPALAVPLLYPFRRARSRSAPDTS